LPLTVQAPSPHVTQGRFIYLVFCFRFLYNSVFFYRELSVCPVRRSDSYGSFILVHKVVSDQRPAALLLDNAVSEPHAWLPPLPPHNSYLPSPSTSASSRVTGSPPHSANPCTAPLQTHCAPPTPPPLPPLQITPPSSHYTLDHFPPPLFNRPHPLLTSHLLLHTVSH